MTYIYPVDKIAVYFLALTPEKRNETLEQANVPSWPPVTTDELARLARVMKLKTWGEWTPWTQPTQAEIRDRIVRELRESLSVGSFREFFGFDMVAEKVPDFSIVITQDDIKDLIERE